ncbi:MAG: methyl-accepting chemotaxis protein [Spirochaetes bacterium]|nr:methyl-accepting chemotaxis protein [Spirochaetota bacterium]
MTIDKSIIKKIININKEIIDTAQNVNDLSHTRKQITSESLLLLSELKGKNESIITTYNQVYNSIKDFIAEITKNSKNFKFNIKHFMDIITGLDSIKDQLLHITENINVLFSIIDKLKYDTELINELATNASIVSSKYQEISSVFEILSAKLNEMSLFINQNLGNIVNVVNPIKDSIDNLKENNTKVLSDIEKGHKSFLDFLDELTNQEKIVNEQLKKAEQSGEKIKNQKKMLNDIDSQVNKMDSDADKAIAGSGNVMELGRNMLDSVELLSRNNTPYNDSIKIIDSINEKAATIKENAQNVNSRSKSQLDFSFSSLEFCKSIIRESRQLEETTKTFNNQSIKNNQVAMNISKNIQDLLKQLNNIESRINNSNITLKKFTEDYQDINKIMDILKNILRLMKIIGIYSRIEASRDPVTFEGFLTISKNIQQLQYNIANMMPKIEQNIKETKSLIDKVNDSYENISFVFNEVRGSSNSITVDLNEIAGISNETEKFSQNILQESLDLDTLLNDLENYLNKLTEVVKQPIEGSAQNINRGKYIEEKSTELKKKLIEEYESEPAAELSVS